MERPVRDETEQKILEDIERHGWSVICILEDASGPSFVYSIGMMHTLNHPEIIIFGLDIDLMWRMVNGIGDDIQNGRTFTERGLYEEILEGFACRIEPVDDSHHPTYLGYAMWHRRHIGQIGTLQAVQCLWPDRNGRFPDEPGCHPEVVRLQPLLR
jgi:hypothetical protein